MLALPADRLTMAIIEEFAAPISKEEDAKCSIRDAWGRMEALAPCGDFVAARLPPPLLVTVVAEAITDDAGTPADDDTLREANKVVVVASATAVGDGIHICVDLLMKAEGGDAALCSGVLTPRESSPLLVGVILDDETCVS